jgi:hypothetical protein
MCATRRQGGEDKDQSEPIPAGGEGKGAATRREGKQRKPGNHELRVHRQRILSSCCLFFKKKRPLGARLMDGSLAEETYYSST